MNNRPLKSVIVFLALLMLSSLACLLDFDDLNPDLDPDLDEELWEEVLQPISGVVETPGQLTALDFEVFGAENDIPVAVQSTGGFEAQIPEIRPLLLIAGPREGSATALELGPENGLLMSPYLGSGVRLVGSGSSVSMASQGDAVINSFTTILSLILIHPALAHPGVDEQQALITRVLQLWNEGALPLTEAANAWEAAILAKSPFDEDQALTALLEEIFQVIFADQERTESDILRYAKEPTRTFALGSFTYQIGQDGITVSEIKPRLRENGIALSASTVNGTGLDYIFTGYNLAPSNFPNWPDESFQQQISLTELYTRSGDRAFAGVAGGSSYWSYLDIFGNALKWVTNYIGGTTLKADSDFMLAAPDTGSRFFEIRFFSGGLGYGSDVALYNHIQAHYADDATVAAMQNFIMAIIELLSVIPGGDTLAGDDTGSKVIQAAAQKAYEEVFELIQVKGVQNVTGRDVYDALYNTTKAAIDKYMSYLASRPQRRALIRAVQWAGYGGRKAVRAITNLPGRISSGGSLSNRAYRFVRPDSLMEVYIIAIGDADPAEGGVLPVSISGSKTFPPPAGYEGEPWGSQQAINGQMTLPAGARYRVEGVGTEAPKLSIAVSDLSILEFLFEYTVQHEISAPLTFYNSDNSRKVEYSLGRISIHDDNDFIGVRGGSFRVEETRRTDTSVSVQGTLNWTRPNSNTPHSSETMSISSYAHQNDQHYRWSDITNDWMQGEYIPPLDEEGFDSSSVRLGDFNIDIIWDPDSNAPGF